MRIVLLGAPGAGKGTFAVFLETKFNIPRISTGDLFRTNLEEQTELGKLAKEYMSKGELVPDDVTCSMVAVRLKEPDTSGGYILDGFPRTCSQADALAEMLKASGTALDYAIEVTCPDDLIVSRLSGRRVCTGCGRSYNVDHIPPVREGICDSCRGALIQREDDRAETVFSRLKTYREKTAPLLDYYRGKGLLLTVNNAGEVLTELPESLVEFMSGQKQ